MPGPHSHKRDVTLLRGGIDEGGYVCDGGQNCFLNGHILIALWVLALPKYAVMACYSCQEATY